MELLVGAVCVVVLVSVAGIRQPVSRPASNRLSIIHTVNFFIMSLLSCFFGYIISADSDSKLTKTSNGFSVMFAKVTRSIDTFCCKGNYHVKLVNFLLFIGCYFAKSYV